jgi:hypothetical protein
MDSGNDLLQQTVQGLVASAKTSKTGAGRTEPPPDELIDAINQVFALFRLNFHNQYYSAFGETEQLNQIKKLWLDSLATQPVGVILRAAKRCIEKSEYLPTLHRFLEFCREARLEHAGLPDAHEAYREACLARTPKHAQSWSHPAVYHAGKRSDWHFLASTPEHTAFPVFRRYYDAVCDEIAAGETLSLPAPEEEHHERSHGDASVDEQRQHLARLREQTGL